MSQSSGELAESGQAFGTPRFGLSLFEAAIGFGEAFGEFTIQPRLLLALLREAVDDHGSEKEKHDAQREVAESLGSQFVFLHRGIEIRTVGGGSEEGPKQREPRATVERRRDDRKIINRIVTAVDSDFAGVIDEDGSQQNLQEDDVEDASFREVGDDLCLQHLNNSDGEENDLLVPFESWREPGQPGKEDEPDRKPCRVLTVKPPGLGIENGSRRYHAASIQPQKAPRRQLDGGFPSRSCAAPGVSTRRTGEAPALTVRFTTPSRHPLTV